MSASESERRARAELVDVATDMLAGRLHLIEGARRIAMLRPDIDESDPSLLLFVAVDSETDHLPVGDLARARCASDWLERCDEELARYLAAARADTLAACREIVRVYSP